MIDEDRYCVDVLTQISSAQAALDKVALGLLDDHAHRASDRDQRTADLMGPWRDRSDAAEQ